MAADPATRAAELLRAARQDAGMSQRDLARAARTSQAAIARYETGRIVPDVRTLDRLLAACGRRLTLDAVDGASGRSGRETAAIRAVAVPADIDHPAIDKAAGIVELPPHVQWSGRRRYDLRKRRDRARVYEQVLREGTDDDVRRFIRLDDLIDLWDDLVLPSHVRRAWTPLIASRRSSC